MPDNPRSKIGLGTVQFGLDYGISNQDGQTPPEEVAAILNYAAQNSITIIDTAHLYGSSEEAIGNAIPASHAFDIITKTIPIKKQTLSEDDLITIKTGFETSLKRLKQSSIYSLMLHHADDLLANNGNTLYQLLERLKLDGKIKKIGVSVYNQNQIDQILERYPIDLIQIPMNIFDQRLLASGTLKKLKQHGIEVHVRSAFLQGVIFMQPQSLPPHLKPLSPTLTRFQSWCRAQNITPAQGALAFLIQQPAINHIICGVNTSAQLQELISGSQSLPTITADIFQSFAVDDINLIDPTRW